MRPFHLFLLLSLALSACAQDESLEPPLDAKNALETTGKGDALGIVEGSTDAACVLTFINQNVQGAQDADAFFELLDTKMNVIAVRNILDARSGADGTFGTPDDTTFPTLLALDAVPYVGPAALQQLLELAVEHGFDDTQAGLTAADIGAAVAAHTELDYRVARQHIFGTIDNRDGWVEGVYTAFQLQTSVIPNGNIMNTEHTWPRSKLSGAAATDLHHLFPTASDANSKRSNFPFGDVVTVTWERGGSKLGKDHIGNIVFEVRPEQRGDTARAMFYVAAVYGYPIDDAQEATLRSWNDQDPVDARELNRNDAVEAVQGNRNPFVDDASLVGQIADF
ncbi:MAG: endonuclease [bacterium]